MSKILIINGPNLNLLGTREPQIYGHTTMEDVVLSLTERYTGIEIDYVQSNHEGAIVDAIQEYGFRNDILGIVLNAGAYTHTSLAIADAIAAVDVPVVEVHISNVFKREQIRHKSMISPVCKGVIAGFGIDSYRLAVEAILNF